MGNDAQMGRGYLRQLEKAEARIEELTGRVAELERAATQAVAVLYGDAPLDRHRRDAVAYALDGVVLQRSSPEPAYCPHDVMIGGAICDECERESKL